MATRIAINGFGRIGRLIFRALVERNMLDGQIEVVAVNDLAPADNLAYLLKYDSLHGRMNDDISSSNGDTLIVNGQQIKSLAMKVTPDQLPWRALGVDVVIESTGAFTKRPMAEGHLAAGAKKVIISAPSDKDVKTILMGVNHDQYAGEDIISNASCTTNCLAPMVYVLLKEGIGLEEGIMMTAHAYTASQALQDMPKSDWRDGRAAAENIVPSATGAAKAIGIVLPEVAGKLTGSSYRVPVACGSVNDLTFRPARDTSLDEINAAMKRASETYLKGIMYYNEDQVTSRDIVHTTYSCIYDATWGIQLNSRFFKISSWYDNEWGFSNRMVDTLKLVTEYGH